MIASERAGTVENQVLDVGTAIKITEKTSANARTCIHVAVDDSVTTAVEGSLVRFT